LDILSPSIRITWPSQAILLLYIYIYIHIYIHTHTHTYIHICVCVYRKRKTLQFYIQLSTLVTLRKNQLLYYSSTQWPKVINKIHII
jgi:hypothetical protein